MKTLHIVLAGIFCSLLCSTRLQSTVIYVSSQQEFDAAHDRAALHDSIIWMSGTYTDILMQIEKDRLFIAAEDLGSTIFTGASRVHITGDHIILQGFQFLEGKIGTEDVIDTRGSYNLFSQINIRGYTCQKYIRVRESSQFVEISYCNFENRLNLDDQNILSILVDENDPGYHTIRYCSFKNFAGIGKDMGIEPIRIGLSTQADRISRSLVEYCYFTQCNGDGEIISSKATQNVYRHNTFDDNPKAELVLRHGSEAIVYGNFFLKGKGGVRVREGQNHYIYNNYFYDLADRSIYLQNRDSDPLNNIHIAFNTIVDCAEVILGGEGDHKPTQVTFANNIFAARDENLFAAPTGTETWISNIALGSLGFPPPATGLTMVDPQLGENSEGFFSLASSSPAISAAQAGYTRLPLFEGIGNIDSDVSFDIMGQYRPIPIEEKDLGCHEHPHQILIRPLATEENTGPSYPTSMTTSLHGTNRMEEGLIKIRPNPVSNQLNIEVNCTNKADFRIDIFNVQGKLIDSLSQITIFPGGISFTENIGDLPEGLFFIRATSRGPHERVGSGHTLKFIKLQ